MLTLTSDEAATVLRVTGSTLPPQLRQSLESAKAGGGWDPTIAEIGLLSRCLRFAALPMSLELKLQNMQAERERRVPEAREDRPPHLERRQTQSLHPRAGQGRKGRMDVRHSDRQVHLPG